MDSGDPTDESAEFKSFSDGLVELLEAKLDVSVERNDDGFITVGDAKANLISLFEVYRRTPPELKQETQMRFVNVLMDSLATPASISFDEARPRLRPKIWSRWMLASDALRSLLPGEETMPQMPTRLLGEHLILSFVLDSEHSMSSVDWKTFCSWGFSFSEILGIASSNAGETGVMLGAAGESGESEVSGQCIMATQDNYDCTRFLSERPFTQFNIEFPRWSFSASRDNCVICSADELEQINSLLNVAFQTSEDDPKQLPPFPLVDQGNGWAAWKPLPNQKVDPRLRQRQVDYLLSIYTEQRSLLQLTGSARKDFAFVETLARVSDSDSDVGNDSQATSTTWQEGLECLLPEADFVNFPDRNLSLVPWSEVTQTCGDVLAPAEAIYPLRWRTLGYPSEQQFSKMGEAC